MSQPPIKADGGIKVPDATKLMDLSGNALPLVKTADMQTALADYQPLDADLTAIAALSTTTFGRALLALANAAALQSAAGTVIGTNVQAWNAFLDTLAAINSTTGSGALARATSPTFVTPALGAATGTSLNLSGAIVVGTNVTLPATSTLLFSARMSITAPGQGLLKINDPQNFRGIHFDVTTTADIVQIKNEANNARGGIETGSLSTGYTAKTSAYTLTTTDGTVNCTSGTFAITLPTAVGATGRTYVVKNTGTGSITLNTTSSQTIDGYASGALALAQWDSYTLQSTGTNWIIL